MGSGKTTLWKKLMGETSQFGFDFDEEIERRNSLNKGDLGKFIEEKGWDEFRKQEIDLLKETLLDKEGTYSLGGGTATHSDFYGLIESQAHAKVLWLNTPVEVCWERVCQETSRPLVKNGKDAFYNLYQERQKYYSNYSEIDENYALDKKNN
jgi:shikimate kinase